MKLSTLCDYEVNFQMDFVKNDIPVQENNHETYPNTGKPEKE